MEPVLEITGSIVPQRSSARHNRSAPENRIFSPRPRPREAPPWESSNTSTGCAGGRRCIRAFRSARPGEPGPQGRILRRGARPGDWLLVTGPLGGSLLGKHLDFTPRVREALQLQEHARLHAMQDISDGLAADVNHLCEESGCGAVLVAESIPIADAAKHMTDGRPPLEHALGDGEDFELAFAVSPAYGAQLLSAPPFAGLA